jgi:hypothetical protein
MIRVYRSDEASESGVELLEEHEFMSEADARECARELVRSDAGLVTFNQPQQASEDVAAYAVKASVHDWTWTYAGISAGEAQAIAGMLTKGSGELWTIEPIR